MTRSSKCHSHLTPLFYGRAKAVTAAKQRTLDDAHHRQPERFVNGPPNANAPPAMVSINPPSGG
jgi:hypothetical protein